MIYEYKCVCGNLFAMDKKISDTAEYATCPKCCGSAKQIISGGLGVIFKGDGFTKKGV